ncbi:hypothetical protein TEA_001166 [Camellia sinensis var. sinensis]|uniref:Uncharacterized protein n=1 Tax=Camellia sinensis var. sinensis TaxID=542762 RepID=A0A4S4D932_CAMSN|nr:hypothetical protein TEA_001166 [Camellia sinensis var. sinensis]
MVDKSNIEHVLDIEEVLHYYSRLTCPAYVDIVDKFFMDIWTRPLLSGFFLGLDGLCWVKTFRVGLGLAFAELGTDLSLAQTNLALKTKCPIRSGYWVCQRVLRRGIEVLMGRNLISQTLRRRHYDDHGRRRGSDDGNSTKKIGDLVEKGELGHGWRRSSWDDVVWQDWRWCNLTVEAMEVDKETSPSYFDPEDLSTRERNRRYGKRYSTSSHDNSVSFSGTRILYDGQSIERWPNAALFLEDIKQEVESFDADQLEGAPSKTQSALWRKSLVGSRGVSEVDVAADSIRRPGSYSLKSCKHEDAALSDGGDTTFTLFASLLDFALQGLMPIPDLILQFERSCRNVSEPISIWVGCFTVSLCSTSVGNEELPEDLILVMHLLLLALKFSIMFSCSYIWLEGLASKVLDLDNELRGSHVGTYLPSSGVWRRTQGALKKEQDGGKYEMAVYAPQCSNLKRILPICTDWEAYSNISIMVPFVWGYREGIGIDSEVGLLYGVFVLRDGEETSNPLVLVKASEGGLVWRR